MPIIWNLLGWDEGRVGVSLIGNKCAASRAVWPDGFVGCSGMSQRRERRCLNVLWWRRLRICLTQSLLCPHRPMLGLAPARWSAKQHQEKTKKNPTVCSRPPFLPPPLFPFHAESRTFCSLSFLPTFFFLSLLHLIFSHLPSPPLSVVSCSTCPPPPLDLMSEEILRFTSAFKWVIFIKMNQSHTRRGLSQI